jgi:hypothetical protein
VEHAFLIMENFITHLLFVSMDADMDFHLARWKMGDQQMAVTILSSMKMGANNM